MFIRIGERAGEGRQLPLAPHPLPSVIGSRAPVLARFSRRADRFLRVGRAGPRRSASRACPGCRR